jgi:hypothetical protein
MSTSIISSTSLPVALTHAITFLTRPLLARYPELRTITFQRALEANLTPYYAASWIPLDPSKGSGRRCLTLSPGSVPPRPIYAACLEADINWKTWIPLLGGTEIDLFVDPGRVFVRVPRTGQTLTIWSGVDVQEDEEETVDASFFFFNAQPAYIASAPVSPVVATMAQKVQNIRKAQAGAALKATLRTAARTRLLRSLVVQTVDLPAVPTPLGTGDSIRSNASNASIYSTHSRDSSSSSSSSEHSDFSHTNSTTSSAATSMASSASTSPSSSAKPVPKPTVRFVVPVEPRASKAIEIKAPNETPVVPSPTMKTATTVTSVTHDSAPGVYKQSRRERARQRRAGIVLDICRPVTAFDDGRTSVLTGGVLLGGARAVRAAVKS